MWLHPFATIYFIIIFQKQWCQSTTDQSHWNCEPCLGISHSKKTKAAIPGSTSLVKSLNGFNPLLPHCKTEVTTLPSLKVSLLRTLFLELNVMTHWNPSRVCGSNVSAVASVGVKVCAVSTGDIKVVPTPIFGRVGTCCRRRIWVCPQLQLLLQLLLL